MRAWFKFFSRDYRDGTRQLTLEERGAYVHVLTLLYDGGGQVLDDIEGIARDMGCATRVWKRLRARLIATGKLRAADGMLTNDRVSSEVAEAKRVSAVRAEAGQTGGLKSGATRASRAEFRESLPQTSAKLPANFDEVSANQARTEIGKRRKINDSAEANASNLLAYARALPEPEPDKGSTSFHSVEPLGNSPTLPVDAAPVPAKAARGRRKAGAFVAMDATMPTEPTAKMLEAAAKAGMVNGTVQREFGRWRDHHISKGTLIADAEASFRMWASNWVSYGAKQSHSVTPAKRKPNNGVLPNIYTG